MAAPGGSSLFYPGCNGAGLVQAEEDPLQRQEPSRFAFPSTCHCWSPFKGHATLPCPPRAGDTQTRRRGGGRSRLPPQRGTAGGAGTRHSSTPKTSHGGGLAEPDMGWLKWPSGSKGPAGDRRWLVATPQGWWPGAASDDASPPCR